MWFSKSIERTLDELKVNAVTGLTEQEGETRMIQYGTNKLQGKKKKTILQMVVALSFVPIGFGSSDSIQNMNSAIPENKTTLTKKASHPD